MPTANFWKNGLSVCLLVLLAGACGRHTPCIAPLPDDAVILAFGDSITAGSGARANQSYPVILEQLLHYKVINAGVPGEVSAEGLARLPQELETHKPALVLLCHGGNDILKKYDDKQTARHLGHMIETIRNAGADVVLIGVPKVGLILSTADFYGELATRYDIPYEGKILKHILSTRSKKSDYIHPNAEGNRALAEAIAALICKAEEKP